MVCSAPVTPAEQLAAQGGQWQAAGRPDMAAPLYASSLDQEPSNLVVRWHLAECLAYLQQLDHAAAHYLQVAHGYALLGYPAECLATCERILQLAPHAFVYASVAPVVRRLGTDARTVCARAAELHLQAGRQTEGLQILRLGTELDADSPEVRLQLARIYKSRNMIGEAVEAMADAGDLLLAAERVRDYAKVAELLLTLAPDHLDTLRELPQAYLELSRPHDAVRMLGQLTRVSPGDIVGYEILARAFASIGHTDKALVVLERLVDELGAIGRGNKGDAILARARGWRPQDLGFQRAIKRMEVPKPASARPPARAPEDLPVEGTVSLNIADLLASQASSKAAAGSDEGVELTEAEGNTVTLRLAPLMHHQLQQASQGPVAPVPSPPPASEVPIPGPDEVHDSLSLDASALIEALANDVPWDQLVDLVNDEEDDDQEDVATELGMKALTAQDIARAQGGGTPGVAVPAQPAPSLAPPPKVVHEDAPTMAHMSALTAADIAKALARPSGGPPPPPPPPPGRASTASRPSSQPPPPPADDEDAMTMIKMDALTPEDIARAQRRGGDDGSRQ